MDTITMPVIIVLLAAITTFLALICYQIMSIRKDIRIDAIRQFARRDLEHSEPIRPINR